MNVKYMFSILIINIFVTIAYYNYTTTVSFTTINPLMPTPIRLRILCLITTKYSNIPTRAKTVQETWAKDCDKLLFVTMVSSSVNNYSIETFIDGVPVLQPANLASDGYSYLTHKILRSIQYLYEHYGNYDWYYKADDDTYTFMDNLRLFLNTKNSSDPLTYGYNFGIIVKDGYHSGGAGYVLSHESFTRLGNALTNNYSFCENTGYEDVDVAACLRKLNVSKGKSLDEDGRERFHPLDVKAHLSNELPGWIYGYAENKILTGLNSSSDSSISFHYVTPSDMRKLHLLWQNHKLKLNETTSLKHNLTSVLIQMIV